MNRFELRKFFKTQGPAILPVIHVLNNDQACANVSVAMSEGAAGVFLINHDFDVDEFLPIIRHVRTQFPSLWLGINFLGVTAKMAYPILAELSENGCLVDGYWADDARIDEKSDAKEQHEAREMAKVKRQCDWNGLYFGGTAFKKQRPVDEGDYHAAASIASHWMDVVTTSGIATGEEAGTDKVSTFRQGVGEQALALASGISPENIDQYANDLDAILVATGINLANDFYHIDAGKLRDLIAKSKEGDNGVSIDMARDTVASQERTAGPRDHRFYLDLMAPRSRGEKYAWLDPSAAYINARSFHHMLDDLTEPFSAGEIDVVAGFDAAGFVLGAGIATRLGKGFLTIRKGGKIPVDYDVVPMTNYSGQTQQMEMRKPAFAKGTRVLLVDQWIETGGTMTAGIQLVERQGGVVAGIAAVCIEENKASDAMREKYKMVSCIVSGSAIQAQCNQQTLESFKLFKPENTFPDIP